MDGTNGAGIETNGHLERQPTPVSENSQTAQDYIASQLRLEADAREALPYQFDTCTQPLGPLRQSVFACLTCTPPPASPHQQFTPAGVCYSCSISCHGEHNLVELFSKRNFLCDCGTTRYANSGTECSLRLNAATGQKGAVKGEKARDGNRYGQNFEGRFCGCGEEYDPEREKGTMFQCLGLGKMEDGGCGEDWWHPECLMGLPRSKPGMVSGKMAGINDAAEGDVASPKLEPVHSNSGDNEGNDPHISDEAPLPGGFPDEDSFEHVICYKCTNAFPWIKQYAGTPGFLANVHVDGDVPAVMKEEATSSVTLPVESADYPGQPQQPLKRKAEDDAEDDSDSQAAKRPRSESDDARDTRSDSAPAPATIAPPPDTPYHATLPEASSRPVTLLLHEDFRDHLCRCSSCFPLLTPHPQLLEEEESYEPPLSEGSIPDQNSVNSGSLLSRGEAALSSMDRVRAIEGVMAYNHVKEKVKAFLKPFAESGEAVGAEEIRSYFAALRGDDQAGKPEVNAADVAGDQRREQGGY